MEIREKKPGQGHDGNDDDHGGNHGRDGDDGSKEGTCQCVSGLPPDFAKATSLAATWVGPTAFFSNVKIRKVAGDWVNADLLGEADVWFKPECLTSENSNVLQIMVWRIG